MVIAEVRRANIITSLITRSKLAMANTPIKVQKLHFHKLAILFPTKDSMAIYRV